LVKQFGNIIDFRLFDYLVIFNSWVLAS